jgi:hypothetical protein
MTLERWIVLAGLGQLALGAASPAIPFVLHWKEETAKLRPVLRHMFWTYGAYILATNLAFGMVSPLAPEWLLDRSGLAAAVTGFMTVYWGGRVGVQVGFDREDVPSGSFFRLAEAALVALFVFLTVVYGAAFLHDIRR